VTRIPHLTVSLLRRLSIGCILVTLPSVLVLDEPTTGLDSFTAFALLETLSRLAKRGRVVILSIHQPRSDAFAIFNKVTLLSAGSVVYSGLASKILPHFESLGYTPAAHTNPLDFVVDVRSNTIVPPSFVLTRIPSPRFRASTPATTTPRSSRGNE
jgi:ABC-type multidrug transport system ATPase subunit